jgi:hypothetical protein
VQLAPVDRSLLRDVCAPLDGVPNRLEGRPLASRDVVYPEPRVRVGSSADPGEPVLVCGSEPVTDRRRDLVSGRRIDEVGEDVGDQTVDDRDTPVFGGEPFSGSFGSSLLGHVLDVHRRVRRRPRRRHRNHGDRQPPLDVGIVLLDGDVGHRLAAECRRNRVGHRLREHRFDRVATRIGDREQSGRLGVARTDDPVADGEHADGCTLEGVVHAQSAASNASSMRAPPAALSVTETFQSCAAAIRSTMAKPRPVPSPSTV